MRELTFREAIIEAMDEEMAKDPMVFMMGENIAVGGGVYKGVDYKIVLSQS